jgi:hypothetical protein
MTNPNVLATPVPEEPARRCAVSSREITVEVIGDTSVELLTETVATDPWMLGKTCVVPSPICVTVTWLFGAADTFLRKRAVGKEIVWGREGGRGVSVGQQRSTLT